MAAIVFMFINKSKDLSSTSCECSSKVCLIITIVLFNSGITILKIIGIYQGTTSKSGRRQSGVAILLSTTSKTNPNTEPPLNVTVWSEWFTIVIGESPSFKAITKIISTNGRLFAKITKSEFDRNFKLKRREKLTPECGLILSFLNNDTVFTV